MGHGSKPAGAIDVFVRKPGGQVMMPAIQKISGPMKAAGRNCGLHRAVMQYMFRAGLRMDFNFSGSGISSLQIDLEDSSG